MKTFNQFIEESVRRKGERYDASQGFDSYTKHPDLEITRRRDKRSTTIHHKPSGLKFKIGHGDPKYSKYTDPDLQGTIHSHKPTHEILVHHGRKDLTPREKINLVRTGIDVYNNHIVPRVPSGSVVSGSPISNPSPNKPDKNAREGIYKKKANFGRKGPNKSKQYSVRIGNRMHPVDNL